MLYNWTKLPISESLIGNFWQRASSQHTVNVNELCAYALPGSCRFRMCIIYEVDRKGAEFTGNIHIQSQTVIFRYQCGFPDMGCTTLTVVSNWSKFAQRLWNITLADTAQLWYTVTTSTWTTPRNNMFTSSKICTQNLQAVTRQNNKVDGTSQQRKC